MNRQQKSLTIESLRDAFSHNAASFLVRYQGLTVKMLQQLRKELKAKGGSFKIAKARLMKRAVQDVSNAQDLVPYFKDQVGVVWSEKPSPEVAKVLNDFAGNNQQLQVIVGCLGGQILSQQQVIALAKLPSREVLLAHLCGTLNAPMSGLVRVLNMLIVRLLYVLNQVAEKKS